MIAHHLATQGLLEAFTRAGYAWSEDCSSNYEPIAFRGLLIGYTRSCERRLPDFFERVAPSASAFMALDAAAVSAPSVEPKSLSG